uniref:Uncharacterized protein n=1 Tax=Cacopsylla melanoneura TaxID=428564 RepID=A0A8D9B2N1_9HEMI
MMLVILLIIMCITSTMTMSQKKVLEMEKYHFFKSPVNVPPKNLPNEQLVMFGENKLNVQINNSMSLASYSKTNMSLESNKYQFVQSPLIFNQDDQKAVLTASSTASYCFISSSVNVLDEFSQLDELIRLTGKLDYGLIKLRKYYDRLLFLKKNYFFFVKQLDSLRADQQYPCIVITGCPHLEDKQKHWFLVNLSRRLHVRYNDTNIKMISQIRNEWQKKLDDKKSIVSIPILVKLKSVKIKNLYLQAAKRELKKDPYIKKFGLSVHSAKTIRTGIFVNDHLTYDKLMRYKLVLRQVKAMGGYMCYVNNSDVYIRKSFNHEPILVNSRHVLRALDKSVVNKIIRSPSLDNNNRTQVLNDPLQPEDKGSQ